MAMSFEEYLEVEDFVKDHYRTFECFPGEVETEKGLVYGFPEYSVFLSFSDCENVE